MAVLTAAFDLDTLITIVALLLYVLPSLLGALRKRQQEEQEPEPEQPAQRRAEPPRAEPAPAEPAPAEAPRQAPPRRVRRAEPPARPEPARRDTPREEPRLPAGPEDPLQALRRKIEELMREAQRQTEAARQPRAPEPRAPAPPPPVARGERREPTVPGPQPRPPRTIGPLTEDDARTAVVVRSLLGAPPTVRPAPWRRGL